jgi:carboxymethylenebutenolidase
MKTKSLILPEFVAGLIFLVLFAGCIGGQQAQDSVVPGAPMAPVTGSFVNITAVGREYPSFLAVPAAAGKYPAIVLIHSFNGLEPGYREMVELMASDGFVVLAPQWQTFGASPPDSDVAAIIKSALSYLASRPEADMTRAGLTGFCAGGRYTMLFLPQMKEFRSGVAWYGFPYNGATNDSIPAMHIAELQVPMLMIHGSRDQASPIRNIYNYSTELDSAGKYFELKVYQGKPHGFMITNGSLSKDDASMDAYREMIAFFRRTLV